MAKESVVPPPAEGVPGAWGGQEDSAASQRRRKPGYSLFLSLAALGVVYGDIGTSPLYAIRESFLGRFGVAPTPENILGVLSLITWSIVLIVAVKYIVIVLRADNEGEGGILALTALLGPQNGQEREAGRPRKPRARAALVALGLFGAALLYGDGMLTPAISVLSAVEGVKVLEPSLGEFVVPIAVAILVGLFLFQRMGTARVGKLFGPITLLWFLVLALLGLKGIQMAPQVLAALNPAHAVAFFAHNGLPGVLVLGAVFLVVTGGEALYADLGHFGRGPIQWDWFVFVMPALLLNYYGQGALVLSDPSTTSSPFFLLAPHGALLPLILLATAATIIASQAVISGVFSLTMQALQLGYWPRLEVRHTSSQEYGQIYVPPINWILMIGTVLLVVTFRSSGALAAAYGVAIVSTMLVTTILLYVVLPERWGWPPWLAGLVLSVFLVAELAFFAANLVKIHEGGWVSLAIAAVVYLVMTTWRDGRRTLGERLQQRLLPLEPFLDALDARNLQRVPGNAIFMTGDAQRTPSALLMIIEHQKALQERVIVLMVENVRAPHVSREKRIHVEPLGKGFYRVTARYGFMEKPDVLRIVERLKEWRLDLPLRETTFFLGRERLLSTGRPLVARWRLGIFSFLSRNSQRATSFFNIPADRVVEVGSQIEV